MENIIFTEKEQVFLNIYSGKFDTPKRLNRSAKKVPTLIIDSIEGGKITSQQIKELAQTLPIFVYKTCLTIHGNFPEIERQRIGYYKNIIQNNNGSLEIRYNAIDYNLKNEIEEFCIGQFKRNRTSTTDNFIKLFRTESKEEAIAKVGELKQRWQNFTFKGMKAKVSIGGFNQWGMYYVILYISPLLIEGNPLDIALQMTDLTESKVLEYIQDKKAEAEVREKKMDENKAIKEAKKQKAMESLTNYRKEQIKAIEGKIYIAPVMLTSGEYGYRIYKVDKKGSFGRVQLSSYVSSSTEIDRSKFVEYRQGKQLKPAEIMSETYILN